MDTKTEKRKIICPQCKGNGYVRALLEEGKEEFIADCNKCVKKFTKFMTADIEDKKGVVDDIIWPFDFLRETLH